MKAKNAHTIKPRKKIRIKSLEKSKDSEIVLYKSCDTINKSRIKIMLHNIKISTRINKRKKEREERILSERKEKKIRDYLEIRRKVNAESKRLAEIKKRREEREKKEYEEMQKKWLEKKLLYQQLRKERIIEGKKRQEFLENFYKKKIEESRKIQIIKKLKIIEDKKRIEEIRSINFEKYKQKQVEEHEKIMERVNKLRDKFDKLEELKKAEETLSFEEKLDIRYNRIKPKCHLFLSGEINDYIERLEFANELEKYLMDEINYNNINKTHNFLTPSEAVFYNNNNYILKLLGFLGCELLLNKINNVYIEKNPSKELIRDISFKVITCGLATQTTYKLTLESPKKKNEFKNDYEQWFKFNDLIIDKLNETFNIPKEDIYFFNYDFENIELSLNIINRNISGISLYLKSLGLKTTTKSLINYATLSPINFEVEFCKKPQDWPKENLKRGGKRYFPPYNYYGLALKIKNKYNDTDKMWFGKEGDKEGEWPIAYHGIGRGNEFLKVLNILDDNLKEGPRQLMQNYKSTNNKNDSILCKKGVYLTPNIEEAEKFANKVTLGNFKKKFQFIIMTRVNPKKIREPGIFPINWILNGNDDEIRPYRLLIKIT